MKTSSNIWHDGQYPPQDDREVIAITGRERAEKAWFDWDSKTWLSHDGDDLTEDVQVWTDFPI